MESNSRWERPYDYVTQPQLFVKAPRQLYFCYYFKSSWGFAGRQV
jgi:hypothetical protein